MRYAGFWRRFAATLIDLCLLAPVFLVCREVILPRVSPEEQQAMSQLVNNRLSGQERQQAQRRLTERAVSIVELAFFMCAPYFVFTESSTLRGTIGKSILGLRVTDLNGRRIRPGRALKRYLARLISAMPAWYGFAMAGLTSRKQALHDYMAGTLVVVRDGTDEPDDS
jgi:uncharacterized RDD family membrane protein YckC